MYVPTAEKNNHNQFSIEQFKYILLYTDHRSPIHDKMYFIDRFSKTFFNLYFEYKHTRTHTQNAINCLNHNENVPMHAYSLAHSIMSSYLKEI